MTGVISNGRSEGAAIGDVEVIVEVTNTLDVSYTTGHERHCREIVKGLQGPAGSGLDVTAVVRSTELGDYRRLTGTESESLRTHAPGGTARRRADRFGSVSPLVRAAADLRVARRARAALAQQRRRNALTPEVRALALGMPAMGSIWFDVEAAWQDPEARRLLLPRLRAQGIHPVVLVADVMPELFPDWFDDAHRRRFGEWLRAHLAGSELFICVSHRTEEDLLTVAERAGVARTLETVVVPLGADFPVDDPVPVALPAEVGRFLLTVGTLEPNKNQALVLDAFDQLHRRHDDLGLVLVGRQGWMVEGLVSRIRHHPEFGRRLLWLDGIDDASLAWLYRNAFLAITPSHYEGLGVPVLEALNNGCPTISSTAGALREASAGCTEEIDPDDADGLVVLVERHLMDPRHHQSAVRRTARFVAPTWNDTAEQAADALRRLADRPPPIGRHHR